MLALAQFHYNEARREFFYLDPDELRVIDSETRYLGANLELRPQDGLDLGLSYLTVPESNFSYFGPLSAPVGTREGLQVYDARFTFRPNAATEAGPLFGAEYAVQRNRNFDMDARAGWADIGYSWPQAAWSPSVSYRFARFSGDDPDTATYERWDPMLSGGTGEQWVQGANHFKVVQDSNVIAHRIQVHFRPSPKVEIVPQLWAFYADSETYIGGNPALSFLDGTEYGFEANVTAKWFVSRNTYVHGTSPTPCPARPPSGRWAARRNPGRASCCSSATPSGPSSERDTDMHRRDMLKFGGAAAAGGFVATQKASAQGEGEAEVPPIGGYARERSDVTPELAQLRDIQPMPDDYFTPHRFAGKTVIVTGCARGLGRVACLRLAREGASLIGVDSIEDLGRETVDLITEQGGNARFLAGDVGSKETCDHMVELAVATFGSLDAALNNTGVMDGASPGDPVDFENQRDLLCAPIHEATLDDWENVFRSNARGVFLSMRAELRQMIAQGSGGSIVNVGSIAGLTGLSGNPAYSASKHAVTGLTRNAALDYAPYGIRVNSVNMAATDTPMIRRADEIVALSNAAAPNPGRGRTKTASILAFADENGRPSTVAEQVSMMC
ncbi:SDR family NAD(P)-dependent oxidoreductase [Rhodosalinus sp. K401]|uniref:SDR family NAD(P)-dependent oxidoreductase n=1 Tax=Rhodosalinus sp. K401 TaxID=3239195 RepID=UPI003524206B